MGRLAFIMRGNADWETESTDGVTHDNSMCLQPNVSGLLNKASDEVPIRRVLQLQSNSFEIWGTIKVTLNLENVDDSKRIIECAINTINTTTNGLSFLFGASLHWIPARFTSVTTVEGPPIADEAVKSKQWKCIPLSKSLDDHSSSVLTDDHIKNVLFPFIQQITAAPTPIRSIIETALDWHAQANRFTSGLNRFVNYWVSIESLGHSLHKTFLKEHSSKEMKQEILAKLKLATQDNCQEIVNECYEMGKPTSARAKINALLNMIVCSKFVMILLMETIRKRT